MAPRMGETDEEKIVRMYNCATKVTAKAQQKQINAALKAFPHHIQSVHKHLVSLGAIACSSGAAESAGTPVKPPLAIEDGAAHTPTTKSNETNGSGGETPKVSAAASVSPEKPQFVLDKNHTRVEMLSSTYLEAALTELEPASLSKANLKRIMKKGCGDYNQKLLLKYWEYATGMGPSMPLTINGVKSWDNFVKYGREQNLARGRRLADLVLPVDFYAEGVYSFELAKKGSLSITRKGEGGAQTVLFAVPNAAVDFQVESNWSENAAVLVQVGGPLVQPLSAIFACAPEPKKAATSDEADEGPSRRIRQKRPADTQATAGSSAKKGSFSSAWNGKIVIDAEALRQMFGNPGKKDIELKFNPKFAGKKRKA